MRRCAAPAGFTLVEMLVSIAASTVILGALFMSSFALHRALHGSEFYASSYSDQRRLIDYFARDLRRSIAVAATDAVGAPKEIVGDAVEVSDRASLVVTLPAYYRSDAPSEAEFDQPLPVTTAEGKIAYGTAGSAPTPVRVVFRKLFLSDAGGVCFVREEAGRKEIIVRDAGDLSLCVSVAADGRSAVLHAWFHSVYGSLCPVVSTFDEVMLRNPRTDLAK